MLFVNIASRKFGNTKRITYSYNTSIERNLVGIAATQRDQMGTFNHACKVLQERRIIMLPVRFNHHSSPTKVSNHAAVRESLSYF